MLLALFALLSLLFKDFVLCGLGLVSTNEVSASDSEDVSSRARRGNSLALSCSVVLLENAELSWKLVLALIGVILGFLLVLFNDICAGTIIEGTPAFSIDSEMRTLSFDWKSTLGNEHFIYLSDSSH